MSQSLPMAGLLFFLAVMPASPADDLAFFESRIRPVLVEHCQKCHSEQAKAKGKLRGGLLLDSRLGWAKGGDSGNAITPGQPDASPLLASLTHEGEVKMPPAGKLAANQIADLREWVRRGAPDPRGDKKKEGSKLAEKPWWTAPRKDPPIPMVNDSAWPSGEIDRFVLARLEAKGLKPSPTAGPEVLARRLAFDLTGLPPEASLVASLRADMSPSNIAREVDRMIASRAFAERWARHWLDIARYAESLTLRGFILKDAWRYRDAVIAAFNSDMPYDQFVAEQIAGDLMAGGADVERERRTVLASYLLMGNSNLEEQDKKMLEMDFVDEQLDVIGKGLLAQTLSCARCHDHKFDPIPTRDYHAMAGILKNGVALEHSNVSKWVEVALPLSPEQEKGVAKAEARLKDLKGRIAALKKGKPGKAGDKASGILKPADITGIVVDDAQAKRVGAWKSSTFSGNFIGDGYVHDENTGKGDKTLTFQAALPATGIYEVRLAYSGGPSRASAVPVTVFSAEGEQSKTIDMSKAPPLEGRFVSLGQYRFEKDGQSFVMLSTVGTTGHVTADAVVFISADSPATRPAPASKADGPDELGKLEAELKAFEASMPRRPTAMGIKENIKPADLPIFIRGNVRNAGPVVPRGFMSAAAWEGQPGIAPDSGGRRELAEWIASPRHPLTARVMANRVWAWLTGEGIVRTVDNFGLSGDKPDDPILLDWLASRFVAGNWSVKKLVREIVLSRTYQQATGDAPWKETDPENRLYGRARVRRLEAECLHDAILSMAGNLQSWQGGPTFEAALAADQGFRHSGHTRAVYLPAFRNSPHELLRVFDMADPSTVTGRRDSGTVVQQALFLSNNPWVREQADRFAENLLKSPPAGRIDELWMACLGRAPGDGERRIALEEIASESESKEPWSRLCRALWASAEFRRLD